MRCPVCNKKLAEFVEGRAVILCTRCKEYRLLSGRVEAECDEATVGGAGTLAVHASNSGPGHADD